VQTMETTGLDSHATVQDLLQPPLLVSSAALCVRRDVADTRAST
jgi:hypothetical protein